MGCGLPRILGVQASGAAPLVVGHPIDHPETIATAIQIGKPARGEQALQAAEESHGKIIAVSDQEILSAQKRLAQEGIWVEPASAAGLAGFLEEVKIGNMELSGKRIVAICTGHGLKDPDSVTHHMPLPEVIPPDIHILEKTILGQ